MKTLHDHTLIYDNECPMCQLYTSAFIKTRMLDNHGRLAYDEATNLDTLDQRRACNEIALLNRKTNTVIYGVDSLFTVIGHGIPIFKPLFNNPVFRTICQRLYSFVSYNRKVIAPGSAHNNCQPDFNYFWRFAYIALAWISCSLVLSAYTARLTPFLNYQGLMREILVCGFQMVFQGAILIAAKRHNRKAIFNYLGHVITVSLMGALALLPMLMASTCIAINPFLLLGYFMLVVLFMTFEHMRRVKLTQMPFYLTYTWIIYRILILLLIL